LAQAKIPGKNLAGAVVASIPQLGQELFVVIRDDLSLNVGQVIAAEYEEGGGRGFNIKALRIDGSLFVRLANPELAIPIIWPS